MRTITARHLTEMQRRLMTRRQVLATSAALGVGATIATHQGGSAQSGTPAISATPAATPFSGSIVRNAWEPAWSAEPPFFTIVDRNEIATVVETIGDGLVEIPTDPQRIFAASGEEDIFIALGIEDRVVGLVAPDDSHSVYTNQEELAEHLSLAELARYESQWEPDLEVILAAQPDLIVGSSPWMISDELYPNFSQIAPTIRYPQVTYLYPRQAVFDYGKLFAREDIATDALATYNDFMQAARERINPVIGEAEVLVTWYQGGGTFMVYPAWCRTADGRIEASSSENAPYHYELGLRSPAAIEALADADRTQYYIEMTMEQFGQIATDYLFISGDPATIQDEVLSAAVIQQMPAYQNDRIVVIDDTTDTGLGYYGTMARVALAVEIFTGEPLVS